MRDDLLLSKKELRLLKLISRTGSIWLGDPKTQMDECKALYRYGILQTADLACYPSNRDGFFSQANSLSISEDGWQYLRRVKYDVSKERMMWARYLITTGIAVIALILSTISLLLQAR